MSVPKSVRALKRTNDSKASKIATLYLIAQCYKDRLEIAANASVVTEALSHVEKMKHQLHLVTIIFVSIAIQYLPHFKEEQQKSGYRK